MSDRPDSGTVKKAVAIAGGVIAVGGLSYLAYKQLSKNNSNENKKLATQKIGGAKKEIDKLNIKDIPRNVKSIKNSRLLKEKGNSHFSKEEFRDAIECYSIAIDTCPDPNNTDMATYFQNRAAANDKLNLINEVVDDCSKAIEKNNHYPKALARRAKAFEKLERFEEALLDITAVAMMEQFSNATTLDMCDRVLKKVSEQKAKKELIRRGDALVPLSKSFVESYITSFCEDPVFSKLPGTNNIIADADVSDLTVVFQQLASKEYEEALETCCELMKLDKFESRTVIDNQNWTETAQLLLIQSTFGIIRGDKNTAWDQLKQLFDLLDTAPKNDMFAKKMKVNAYIKRGSFYMQQGEKEKAFDEFEKAVEEDVTNPDVYHHRGQLYVLVNQTAKARDDFNMCTKLKPDFGVARAQGAYADYRDAQSTGSTLQSNKAINRMETMCTEFPFCSEAYALLGQVYAEKQNYDDAMEQFDKALKLNPTNANLHVHKALLVLSKEEQMGIEEARREMQKAVKIDPHCEFAYETLGTVELQLGNTDLAIENFEKALGLARTELELTHIYSLREAANAQGKAKELLGLDVPNMMGGMANLN